MQDLIANLDLYLPWLVPALETIEQAAPLPIRLLACIPLMAWLVFLRHRSSTSAASRLRRAAL